MRCLLVLLALASPARAEPIATCGADKLELAGPAHVRARLGRWRFDASVALARAGATTRTIVLEDLRGTSPLPAQLFVDLFPAVGKVQVRHASEGAPDPAVALDLGRCTFGDTTLFAPEPVAGCGPDVLRAEWIPRLEALKLPVTEARALCDDHAQTLAARAKLEQRLSDTIARARTTARGAKLAGIEELRTRAYERLDGCVAKVPAGTTLATLRAAETQLRGCYDRAR